MTLWWWQNTKIFLPNPRYFDPRDDDDEEDEEDLDEAAFLLPAAVVVPVTTTDDRDTTITIQWKFKEGILSLWK